jgi:crossover junction endodeoxyribonuclease RuvC
MLLIENSPMLDNALLKKTGDRRILGIDPGSRYTGFGLIDVVGKTQRYVSSGAIKTVEKSSLADRITLIAQGLTEIIDTYKPDEVAIEKVFFNMNPAGSLVLGQARGACMAAVALKHCPIFEYTALQIKQSVVGHGKAPKSQVMFMVKTLLSLSGDPQEDAADALACAITHAHKTALASVVALPARAKNKRWMHL